MSELEARIAAAERRALEQRPRRPARDRDRTLAARREQASAIVDRALAFSDADRSELGRLLSEHDSALRRLGEETKAQAIGGSTEVGRRLDELARAEQDALHALPDDWRNPWVPSWPPVYFIRTTPGAHLLDSHIEDANNWAKWQCSTPELTSEGEKVSFFHLWQNTGDALVLADVSVRMNLAGYFEVSAEGVGLPGGWFWENRSDADVSAQLTVWPLWLAHDPAQQPQHSIPLADLSVTAGVFSHSTDTSLESSVLVRTSRYPIPAQAFVLIEASIVLEHVGAAELDLASGDFRVAAPYCFVTVPVTEMSITP